MEEKGLLKKRRGGRGSPFPRIGLRSAGRLQENNVEKKSKIDVWTSKEPHLT